VWDDARGVMRDADPTDDQLFALMEEAMREDDDASDPCFPSCESVAEATKKLDHAEPMVVRLDSGNVHVCRGFACPFLMQSSDVDKTWFCQLSGRVISHPLEAAHDSSWTGRSCGSADPDMHSGACAAASWRNKRTAFAASAAAYSRASDMTVGEVEAFDAKAPTTEPRPAKRGAPCVVDVNDGEVNMQKRAKALKRVTSLQNRDVQLRLTADAASVVTKLYTVLPTTGRTPKKHEPASSIAPATATIVDARLENFDFVLKMALKRYVARCREARALPTLTGIHDVAAAANLFVKGRQKEASERRDAYMTRRVALNGRTIELCSSLIFSLWSVMCSTVYFVEHQTGDSFRPFAAGVMYGLKRGVRLHNNLVVVPAIEQLASQLPELRSTTATAAARQLQQASHKGLCALHRGIASIEQLDPQQKQDALARLQVAAKISSDLVAWVESAMRQEAKHAE
jgi:hypothetical protein